VDFYYSTIMLCSQDNILNVDNVLKLELYQVLGYLAYRMDKLHKQRQEAQKAKSIK